MAHLTDIPYINHTNIITLLNDLAIDLKVTNPNLNAYVDILIVGGSALALKYNFRSTVDIDADIKFSGSITNCITSVARKRNIPTDWLNQDFTKSYSYSKFLWQNAIIVTTLQGYLRVYVVSDLDQLCMKVTAGRNKDFKDINKLLEELISRGCTYSIFMDRFKFLYGDYVKPNKQALSRVYKMFKKFRLL